MSSANTTALDVAITQAAERHRLAEKAMAQAHAKLRSAQSTFHTLDTYRAEYAGRLRHITSATKDALINQRRFLDKLGLALEQQREGVVQANAALAHQQEAWANAMRKLKAMELVRDRRLAAALGAQKRQEQKQSDEFAARAVRRAQMHAGDAE